MSRVPLRTRVLRLRINVETLLNVPLGWLRGRQLAARNRRSTTPVTGEAPLIVSLTSYGPRLGVVHLAIESIAAGTVRPQRLILWVDEGTDIEALPAAVLRLRGRGLEIRPTLDLGPYKKIIPTLPETVQAGGGRLPVVTADDDVLYPRSWLSRLIGAAAADPELVHCFRARDVVVHDGQLAPYAQWRLCVNTRPGFDRIATGVSGVYYPPALLDALAAGGDAFREKAPRADDLWAHHTAVAAGIRIRQVSSLARHFPEIPGTRQSSLYASNLKQGANDPQIAATYTPAAIERIQADREHGAP